MSHPTETDATKDEQIALLQTELRALTERFSGFVAMEVDLRIDGKIRSVTILAKEQSPLFSVV